MNGIVAYGAYIPYWRLDRKAIGEALGAPARHGHPGRGLLRRGHDVMGVEAARAALRGAPASPPPRVYFATADPAYLDKTNATAIHAALDLDRRRGGLRHARLGALGGRRAARRARRAAGRRWPCSSDIRTGLPGGGDERDGGDARGGLPLRRDDADAPVLAEPIARRLGHRRVPRPLAGARRAGLAAVGGALRRARLRAARPRPR